MTWHEKFFCDPFRSFRWSGDVVVENFASKFDASTSGDSLVSKLWRMVDKHLSINRVSYVPRVGEVLNSEFSMCLKTPGHTPEAVALTFELRSLGPAAALPRRQKVPKIGLHLSLDCLLHGH